MSSSSWAALGHNDRVGGLVFGDNEHYEIKPRRSKQSLLQLLNRLVRVNQSLSTESRPEADALGMALRRGREVLRPGSLVIVICDERALTEGAEQQLSLLSRHCDLLLLPISDPLDHALPAAGLLRFAERGAQLELDTLNFDLRQAYKAQAEARKSGLLPWLRPDAKSQVTCRYEGGKVVGIDAVVLSTQHNPDVSYADLREGVMELIVNHSAVRPREPPPRGSSLAARRPGRKTWRRRS